MEKVAAWDIVAVRAEASLCAVSKDQSAVTLSSPTSPPSPHLP